MREGLTYLASRIQPWLFHRHDDTIEQYKEEHNPVKPNIGMNLDHKPPKPVHKSYIPEKYSNDEKKVEIVILEAWTLV